MIDLPKETLINLYKTIGENDLKKLGIYEQAKFAYEEKQKIETLREERIGKAIALVNEAIELLNIYDLGLIVRKGGVIKIRDKHGEITRLQGGNNGEQRTKKGMKTSQKEYMLPILKTIEQLGGRGRSIEVLNIVYEAVKDVFKPVDLERLPSGQDFRWRNTARWARNAMVNEGLLRSDSPHGFWEISEKGKDYLRENFNE